MPLKKPVLFETTFARYTGTDIIGEGGAGRVYKANDDSGNLYAVKVLNSQKASTVNMKRFKNEVEFCRRNQHRNIVRVVDNGILIEAERHSPFYVMPLYPSSLKKLLEAGIPHDKILPYFSQLLDGVEAAHLQRVTHRDLKPENVLYDRAQDVLIIADFGIAHFEEEDIYTAVKTSPNDRLANFQYASPEQHIRGAQVDQRADIYALGLILNEMFTGMIPYGTGYKTIESVAPDYAYLDEMVSQMLDQSPSKRPETIDAIKQQLIGRRNDFINRQRLSELKATVVPVSETDDPLVVDPPHLIDFDYERGALHLILSRPVNQNWTNALHNMGNYSYTSYIRPDRVSVSGNRVSIQVPESEIQNSINYFKGWLPTANQDYARMVYNQKRQAEQRLRKQLEEEIAERERRQRLRASIKI